MHDEGVGGKSPLGACGPEVVLRSGVRPLVELRYTKGNGPLYLAAGDETQWAAHGFGEVAAFESTTMEPTGVSADLGPNVNGIALGGDRLWFAGQRADGRSTVESVELDSGERAASPLRCQTAPSECRPSAADGFFFSFPASTSSKAAP